MLEALEAGTTEAALSLADYRRLLAALPAEIAPRSRRRGAIQPTMTMSSTALFGSAPRRFGTVLVALPPERGRLADRRATYHDATLPPRHAVLAFGLWLRHTAKADAIVHMGAHGTLEWLPGKAVALTSSCFPEAVVGDAAGDLPLHRLKSGGGGASQAPDRRHHHRPSAAAAGEQRAVAARRSTWSGWWTSTPSPTGSTGGGANCWRG